jgi:tetratricopeptide (TPR) repeat protein
MQRKEPDKRPTVRQLESIVWDLLKARDIKQAVAACQQLNHDFPNDAAGWHASSHVAMRINNPGVALTAAEKSLTIEPGNNAWLLQKGVCLAALSRMDQLNKLLEDLSLQEMATAYQCSAIGALLCQAGEHDQALVHYRRAILLKPDDAQHYYNIACLQRSLGQVDESEKNFDKDIALAPMDYEAYKIRSELRTQTKTNNHIDSLEALLSKGISDKRGKVNICFALAKEMEDVGDSAHSFVYLKQGADTRRSYMKYDVDSDLGTMAAIQQAYPGAMFESSDGFGSSEPIFIIGMPRTGTTLVERILASHTDVFAAGELTNFAVEMMGLAKNLVDGRKVSRNELVAETTRLDFRKLGESYIDSTRPFTGQTIRFIDKMPLNFLYTGLIHRALPNAKIICLTRDPLDTCYSIYKQLFIDAYPFSYDLTELGQYFVAYHRLMQHWYDVLPGVIHQVNYEDLVADIEPESHRLLAYCDLDWQPQCLKFYENKAVSTTASAVQIRQPVYRSSIQKWRQYQDELAPLISVLEKAGIAMAL